MVNLETYQHFEGGVFLKLCEAKHGLSQEEMVVYACATTGEISVLPKNVFYQQMRYPHYTGPRFIRIPPIVGKKRKIMVLKDGNTGTI